MNKRCLILSAACFFGLLSSVVAFSAEPKTCAILTRHERGAQIIPVSGSTITNFTDEMPVSCGSMIYTYKNVMSFKDVALTSFKMGTESFFELGNVFYLYRGQILVSSVPNKKAMTISTPNANIAFKGGLAWISYDQEKKVTTVASFNGSFEFKNKFNMSASQIVHIGEMSKLSISELRVVPTQPEIMSASSVTQALAPFHLPSAEQEEMSRVVVSVYEERNKSLTSDIDDWKDIETPSENRTLASDAKVAKKIDVIQPEEAAFTINMMKKHLYGGDEDLNILKDKNTDRMPASAKVVDPVYEQKKKTKQKEVNDVLKGISNISE